MADASNTEEITHNLLEFLKSTTPKTLKLPPQASLTSKDEKKAHMLNRVQQARFERELTNIAIEKKSCRLSAVYNMTAVSRKLELIEKCKERVAKENAKRRNLEDIQRLAEDFFAEQRRQDSLAYTHSRYNMNFIEAMTSSKLNQLLQTTLPDALIDQMLGQEKVRQQRRTLYLTQDSQKIERKPRTLFELIQLLKKEGKLKGQSVQEQPKPTEFVQITKRSRQLSERSKMRWKKAFAIIVSRHREAKKISERHRQEVPNATDVVKPNANNRLGIRRAVTCPHITRGYNGSQVHLSQNYADSQIRSQSAWDSSIVKLRSARPVSGTDAKARIRGLIAQERIKQQQTKIKISKYYKTLEDSSMLDTHLK